ncbi:EamA family transporter [Auraticoccus sp. F435]|uniref:EamA family transporter n=1 Tax=Auraticoccus cholistanensis TaxID=2656650 RepID=A0A6A9V1F0_9ACTN|nr:EamA family transporter [Auraticoccus cholistanensis]
MTRTEQPADGLLERVPATWLVLTGVVSVQVGAALAKDLFSQVPPTAMVLLRLATATAVLLAVARPRLRGRTRRDWLVVLAFGLALAGMNVAIYQSFARIPLGMAVTIEFLGPLAVAVVASRRLRDVVWVVLAGAGVALLGFDPTGLSVSGVLYALAAAACWAAYILCSARTGRRWSGLSGLAVASVVGLLLVGGPAVAAAGSTLLRPEVLLLGVAVGVLSSVIPYSAELSALRRMPPRVFGVLMSLEPAAAALAALLLLGEALTALQWLALACVVLASAGATRSATPRPASVRGVSTRPRPYRGWRR